MNGAAEARNNGPLLVDEIHRKLNVRIRKFLSRSRLAMLGLVTVSGDQIRTVNRAINRHFASFAAANRANLFALCGAKPLRWPLFTNRAGHAHSSCRHNRYRRRKSGYEKTRNTASSEVENRVCCYLLAACGTGRASRSAISWAIVSTVCSSPNFELIIK